MNTNQPNGGAAEMGEAAEIIDDYFAFEAAVRGPESKFAVGDRVVPTFNNNGTGELGVGTVTETIPPNRAYRGVGAVMVKWQNGGYGSWAHDSVRRVNVQDAKPITTKYRAKCAGCSKPIPQRSCCYWSPSERGTYHTHCL